MAGAQPSTTSAHTPAGEVVVALLEEPDAAAWDAYVDSHPDGTFYHLSGWRRVIGGTLGHPLHYLVARTGGAITGVLPLASVSSWLFGRKLVSMPFLVYGGPLASDLTSKHALVDAAWSLADSLGVDALELRDRDAPAVAADGWEAVTSHVTYRKALESEPDANMRAVPRKQRAMIRKGIKAGLVAEIDGDVTRLHETLLECKRNLGTPFFSRRYLAAIKDAFGEAAEILTVVKDGQTVCSVMSFIYRDEILPYYGGGGALARQFYGNDFMYWSVMERACQNGIRYFDYGRSQRGSGPARFKEHWGFEASELHYRVRALPGRTLPDNNPDSPRYRQFVKLWKKLPLPVAGTIGPYLASRLP
ncbi:MAG: FemAB family XrtA/PEP-CTERM system-associated protein [Pseudomonadota bacterium]